MNEFTRTIRNLRGETLTVKLQVVGRASGTAGSVARHIKTVSIVESSAPAVFGAENTAVFESGAPVQHWEIDGSTVEMTSGDEKRMSTYPLYIYANGDQTKLGRFKLFDIKPE